VSVADRGLVVNKQSRDRNQSKRAARLFKKHEASYRALINLLIRQVEREVREELDRQAPPADQDHAEDRKDEA
jgi:hypothetical protein